jgi:hypothetical protein
MAKTRILLDSNVYLRIANSFHPLLHHSFGKKKYTLYVIPQFQKEFDRNPRLINKFGWVNEQEYVENRKHKFRISLLHREQIQLTYPYLWQHNINEGLGASSVDVRALAFGSVLGVPVVTDDLAMTELGQIFGIQVWGLLDILKLMKDSERINLKVIRILLDYLKYMRDLPYPAFYYDARKVFTGL